jgi:hypothetical protein
MTPETTSVATSASPSAFMCRLTLFDKRPQKTAQLRHLLYIYTCTVNSIQTTQNVTDKCQFSYKKY